MVPLCFTNHSNSRLDNGQSRVWTLCRWKGQVVRAVWSARCVFVVCYLVRRLALGLTMLSWVERLTIPSYTGSVQLSSSLIGTSCKVSEVVGPTLVFRDDLKNTSMINQDQPRSSVIKLEARSSEIRDTSISVVVDWFFAYVDHGVTV